MSNPSVQDCVARIRARSSCVPDLGVVLGSGFAGAASQITVASEWAYSDLPGFANAGVPGHSGRLLLGDWGGVTVAALAGRAHFYEGHDLATVTFPIRVLAALGARCLLLTNAAGGIRPGLTPGDLVILSDHLNFMGVNPLRGCQAPAGFVDLSEVYDPELRRILRAAGRDVGIELGEGVYAAVSGPSYETPAEIRAFGRLGADLVGMSTVPEAIVGRQCGLRVAGLSCVTNLAAGLGGRISHQEVLDLASKSGPVAARLLLAFNRRLAAAMATDSPR